MIAIPDFAAGAMEVKILKLAVNFEYFLTKILELGIDNLP